MTPDKFAQLSAAYGPWFATTVILGIAVVFLGKVIINDIKGKLQSIADASLQTSDALERLMILFEERMPKRGE